MEEQVGAGGEQERAAQGAFDRDQAKDESCARRVAGPHRQSLSTSACRSDVLDSHSPAESVQVEDVAVAIEVMGRFLERLGV